MKRLVVTIGVLLAMQAHAQVYRNCTVLLNAAMKDSSFISAQSKKAWLELDLKSNEITLIVKLGTFESTDSIKQHEFDGPNEKFYFRGRFDGDAYTLLNEMVNDETHNISGTVQLNSNEQSIIAKYSIFKGSDKTTDTGQRLFFSLIVPIKLSDYELQEKLIELQDDVVLHLVRQPVNLIGAQDIIR